MNEGFVRDGRIGHSHLSVPGPDGKKGFGGSCFPKDIQALISFGKDLGLVLPTLTGAWDTNLMVRPEKDWEKLEGRAVVKKEEVKGSIPPGLEFNTPYSIEEISAAFKNMDNENNL